MRIRAIPWQPIIIGLVIREAVSFWTGHPYDFEIWVRLGHNVFQGVTPYGVYGPVEGLSFSPYESLPSIGYPPLWALLVEAIYGLYLILPLESRFLYYFLLKQPIIFGDIALGLVLYSFLARRQHSRRASRVLWFWMLNPVVILVSAVWGMFDSLTMFTYLMLLLLGRTMSGGFLYVVGVFLKGVTVIYSPIVLGLRGYSKRDVIAVAILGATASAATLLFLRGDLSGLLAAGASQLGGKGIGESMNLWYGWFFFRNILQVDTSPLTLVENLFGILWIPGVIVSAYLALRRFKNQPWEERFVHSSLVVTLVFFLLRTAVNEQHLIYALSLMLLDNAVGNRGRWRLLTAMWVVGGLFLISNNTLLIRFLTPVLPSAFNLDLAINNAVPTGVLRYTLKLFLALASSAVTLQYLHHLWSDKEARETRAFTAMTRIFSGMRSADLVYLLFIWWGSAVLDFVVTGMITDWDLVISRPYYLGIPIFGWYHIALVILVIFFNVILALHKHGDLRERLAELFKFTGLSYIAAGLAQPAYTVLAAGQPFAADQGYIFTGYLDIRVFVVSAIALGLIILWLRNLIPQKTESYASDIV